MKRTVHHADAIVWLRENAPLAGASVVTSLPDLSELPALGFVAWSHWFEEAAELIMRSIPDDGVAIFFQSDIRHAGRWVDKGMLCARAADRAGLNLLFHRIVCRKPPGTATFGRASYAHLQAFSRQLASPRRPSIDVLPDGGRVPGRKAMGVRACYEACRFILEETPTRLVVDPFCGWGTVLAVANALGMDSVGVDLSARMCRRARALTVDLATDCVGGGPLERDRGRRRAPEEPAPSDVPDPAPAGALDRTVEMPRPDEPARP
jgi:hypothetical protein